MDIIRADIWEEVDLRPFYDFTIDHENNMVILDQRSYEIEGLISENSFAEVCTKPLTYYLMALMEKK